MANHDRNARRTGLRRPREAGVSATFEEAAREFEALLKQEWEAAGPVARAELKPDWWGADLVPGALHAAGETST